MKNKKMAGRLASISRRASVNEILKRFKHTFHLLSMFPARVTLSTFRHDVDVKNDQKGGVKI